MSDFINTVDVIGENALIDSIIERTITEFKDNTITSLGHSTFAGCVELVDVVLPMLEEISDYAFSGCIKLKKVDFSKVAYIGTYYFGNCPSLDTLILRGEESAVGIGSSSAISSSQIAAGTGYIYVPATLVDTYKAASGWSTYANQFRALEDYTVDGTTTGELDETKI